MDPYKALFQNNAYCFKTILTCPLNLRLLYATPKSVFYLSCLTVRHLCMQSAVCSVHLHLFLLLTVLYAPFFNYRFLTI